MNLSTLVRGRLASGSNRIAAMLSLFTLALVQSPNAFAQSSVAVGSNVTFLASAEGSPSPTFQWRKNGNPIPGATSQVLSIAGATLADAAVYQVVAANEVGSATSPDEVLVVETAPSSVTPVITSQPAALQTLTAGDTATFTVAASGTPALTYQWRKNGGVMAEFTGPTLTLTSITTSDSATYTAVASNSAGSVTSNPASLVVTAPSATPPPPGDNAAPLFTLHPWSLDVMAGSNVSFTIATSGSPAPTIQWQRNGETIPGATNQTLSLPAAQLGDSNSMFVAVATNLAGSATSNVAGLWVSPAPVVTPPPSTPPSTPPPSTGTNVAPVITTQPAASQTLAVGSRATLTIAASGTPAPTFQWRKNGAQITGATNSTLSISPITTADAATYSVVATNAVGTAVSNNATIAVNRAPVFTVQPLPQTILAGVTAKFSVVVTAIPGATLQWKKDGVALSGATGATLTLTGVTTRDVGSYTVVASNALGSATSTKAALTIATPPVITKQPVKQTVALKANVTFSTAASGSPAPTFQWKKNGVKISGANSATITLKGVSKTDAGDYSVEATNAAGWVASSRATLTVLNADGKVPREDDGAGDVGTTPDAPAAIEGDLNGTSRLVNLSVRATAGTGSSSLIVGFVIDGSSTKPLLIRGVGPALLNFGVAGVLLDPKLSLYSGTAVAASNDDWMTNDNAVQIAGTSARVGAFSLPDRASDSALMATLETGAYTVQLSGKEASSGVALVEVYDAASGNTAKLVNLSVRAQVGSGSEAPNIGFVVAGTQPKRVLIRAVGPTLGLFGVTDALADPQLELFEGSTRIDQNDNWGGSAELSATFNRVGAFGFADPSSRDAVLLTTLAPGAYTVVVSGANGTTGVGLVELYEVSETP